MLKKILIICFLLSGFLFSQQFSNDKYEKYVGTKLGKYPLTVTGLKKAINTLDSGVVYISYPGLWDTTGLGAIPSKVILQGYLFGELVYSFNGGSSYYTNTSLENTSSFIEDNFAYYNTDTVGLSNMNKVFRALTILNTPDYNSISIKALDHSVYGGGSLYFEAYGPSSYGQLIAKATGFELYYYGNSTSSEIIADADGNITCSSDDTPGWKVDEENEITYLGDWDQDYTGTAVKVDHNNSTVTIGDFDTYNNGTKIIINDNDSQILIPVLPSDSTSCVSGQLWFNNSTGQIHRKF